MFIRFGGMEGEIDLGLDVADMYVGRRRIGGRGMRMRMRRRKRKRKRKSKEEEEE